MRMSKRHIVVIGGGMAGTAAAHALVAQGCTVTIVEQNDYLGGRIRSLDIGDTTGELGAAFITDFYSNVLSFVHDSGLGKNLQERHSAAAIVRSGQPHDLAKVSTLLGGSWLSFGAKLRLVSEVLRMLPAWHSLDIHDMWRASRFDTVSVAAHFGGPRGQELVEYLFGPVLNGYLYWRPEHTSWAMAMILLKAAITQKRTYVLRGGLHQLPTMAAKGSTVLLEHTAQQVERTDTSAYRVVIHGPKGKQILQADGVVCATTASAVPRLFPGLGQQQRAFFAAVQYSTTAVVAGQQPRSSASKTFGVAYPRKENLPLAAMTVMADLSPVIDLIKLYASGAVGKKLCAQNDKQIATTLAAAAQLNPKQAWHVQRWPEALPLFDVGHLHRLRAFWQGIIEDVTAPIVFAGDYLGGPFIEGAYTSGVRAADRLLKRL